MLLDTQNQLVTSLKRGYFFEPDSKDDYKEYIEKGVQHMQSFLEREQFYTCLLYTSPSPRD